MYSILFKLLPYALVIAGVVLLGATVMTFMEGTEGVATEATLTEVTAEKLDKRWLTISGGGFFMPEAVVDHETDT